MNIGPPNWIAWVADLGSILGFVATVVLAVQTWNIKKKYQRLIRLNRYFATLDASLAELNQLIEEYTSSSAGIQGWIGSTSGHLKALASECQGHDKSLVGNVLSNVASVKSRVTQIALIQIYGDVSEVRVMVERIAEDAKINI